jgi:hypothetical protein
MIRLSSLVSSAAHDVHRAASKPFLARGYLQGHVTGYSIGMMMMEHPRDR